MKVALILPSNLSDAPYLDYYTNILKQYEVNYDIIYWNKLDLNQEYTNSYSFNYKCDYSENILKKFVGYYYFSRYVKKTIHHTGEYDRLIVFIPQLAIFLGSLLQKEYRKKFILDIRDYGKANRYMKKLIKVIDASFITVISSAGYKKWLPSEYKYVLSHNTSFGSSGINIDMVEDEILNFKSKKKIVISNIGIIRSFETNCKFIDSLSKSSKYELNYIGKGISEIDLKKYCNENDISNVNFYGRYEKSEEMQHYKKSDFINILNSDTAIGNNTAMANRIYNGCISKCPMIVTKGSYMADIIKEFDLGFELDVQNDNVLEELNKYINEFNHEKFINGCNNFMNEVVKDQNIFKMRLLDFLRDPF